MNRVASAEQTRIMADIPMRHDKLSSVIIIDIDNSFH